MINSPIEEIKNRLDIIEVIGRYIKLQKCGRNFRAICPFHSEKKPSFFVSQARQIWHCFGCQKGGSVFNFIMEIEGIEFGDALRMLAQKAGVELKPQSLELKTARQRLYEISEIACRFFEKQMEGSTLSQEVKQYLLERGISQESIKKWRLGWAPASWQGLSDFLVSQGYKREEVEKAGLSIRNEQGNFHDRFRERIMFPIFDFNSQVVGFSGRIFSVKQSSGRQESADVAKYINTPGTILYDKSQILYGLDKARVEIRKQNSCVLVEGNVDAILAHQAGNTNTVAISGTALTPYHLKILKRYSENLFIAFDMDIAGEGATKRGIDLAQALGFNIRVVRLPEGKDPAEIISKNPEEWQKAVFRAKSILDFYFEIAFSRNDSRAAEGKKQIAKILLPPIKRIPNQIEKSFWIQKLAKDLEVREEDLREELKKAKSEADIYNMKPEEIINMAPKSRRELLEERLLVLLFKSPFHLSLIGEDKINYFFQKTREVLIGLKENQNLEKMPAEILDHFNYLSLKSEVEEMEEEFVLPEIKFCLKEIQCLEIKNKLGQISAALKKAEDEKEIQKVQELTRQFHQCSTLLNNLEI